MARALLIFNEKQIYVYINISNFKDGILKGPVKLWRSQLRVQISELTNFLCHKRLHGNDTNFHFRALKVWNHEWFVQPLKMEMTSPLLTKINGEIVLFLNSFAGDATKYDFWTFLY